MRSKMIALLILGVSLFVANGAYAGAKADDWSLGTTSSFGSTTGQSTFTGGQQPYGYLTIDQSFFGKKTPTTVDVKWVWSYDGGKFEKDIVQNVSWSSNLDANGNFSLWSTPDKSITSEPAGDWTLKVKWGAATKNNIFTPSAKTTSFNVVAPEPISATLFLLGGAGLAIRRFRGKKSA